MHTSTWEEHLLALRCLFTRLKECNLTAKPSKCYIGCDEVDFLGHKLGQGKVSPQVQKVENILQVVKPETKKELRSYLGMIGYHRKFIPGFAHHASKLHDMLGKGKPNKVVWSPETIKAFQFFKEKLSTYPVLRLPDFSKEMVVAVDSSDIGIGGALLQNFDGQLCPILYISRKLKPAETRYSAIERECLALVWAVKTLHSYLYGRKFTLMTDHQPLAYISAAKYSNNRVMRWALDLQIYRYNIKVIKGKDNHVADYLSRRGID